MIADTMCNMRFDTRGMSKCHGGLDEILTQKGDTALLYDRKERMLQQIGLWMSVKLGERFDPKLGCVLHSYLHEQMSPEVFSKMQMVVAENLYYNFPNWKFQNITVQRAMFPDDDVEKVAISIQANDVSFAFLTDGSNLLELHNEAQKTIKNSGLLNITQQRGY